VLVYEELVYLYFAVFLPVYRHFVYFMLQVVFNRESRHNKMTIMSVTLNSKGECKKVLCTI